MCAHHGAQKGDAARASLESLAEEREGGLVEPCGGGVQLGLPPHRHAGVVSPGLQLGMASAAVSPTRLMKPATVSAWKKRPRFILVTLTASRNIASL